MAFAAGGGGRIGSATVEAIVIGRYDDRVAAAIERGTRQSENAFKRMATAAKAFITILAAREVKQFFNSMLNFAREYNTQAAGHVKAWDNAIIRIKSAIANSETFKSIMETITKAVDFTAALLSSADNFKNIMMALGNVIVVFFEGVGQIITNIFASAANKVIEFQDKLTQFLTFGQFSIDFRFEEQAEGLSLLAQLAKAQRELDEAVKTGLSGINVATKKEQKKLEDSLRASKVGPAAAQADALIMEDMRVAQVQSELDKKRLEEYKKFHEEKSKVDSAAFDERQRLRMLEAEIARQDAIDQIELKKRQVAETQQLFGNLANALALFGKKTFLAHKLAAIGEAAISTYRAVAEALPNIPLAISVGTLGAAQIAKIAATQYGGRGGGGGAIGGGGGGPRRDFGSTGGAQTNTGPQVNLQLRFDRVYGKVDEDFARGVTESVKDILINDKRLDRFTL